MQPHFQGNRTRRELMTEDLEFIEEPVEDHYTAAHRAGLDGKCWTRYSKCPISIFKILNI